MTDLFKSMLRFSTAASLFSADQLARIATGVLPGGDTQKAAAAFEAASNTLESQLQGAFSQGFGDASSQLRGEMVDVASKFVQSNPFAGPSVLTPPSTHSAGPVSLPVAPPTTPPPAAPVAEAPAPAEQPDEGPPSQTDPAPSDQPSPDISPNAKSAPTEEVFVRYGRGSGSFSADKAFIVLSMKEYHLNGAQDGIQKGVWHRQFSSPADLNPPAPPTGPMNEPVGPVPHVAPTAQTKVYWRFEDGSEITAVGPAAVGLLPLTDGSFLFLVSTAQIVTSGSGRFEGAYGLVQSLGATHVPAGVDLFGPGDLTFPASTMDTYRVIRPNAYPDLLPGAPSTEYDYQSEYVQSGDSKMHYIEQGEGDPILFLHGNPTWSYLWRNVIPHLSKQGRCIAPDLIGMGFSQKPPIGYTMEEHLSYLEGFIEALGLKNITLVLHDQGTTVGLMYARRNPDNIKAISICEGMMKPYRTWNDFPAALRDTFKLYRDPTKAVELLEIRNVFVEGAIPAGIMRGVSERLMYHYRQPFAECDSRKVIRVFTQELPVAGKPANVQREVAQYSGWLKSTPIPKQLIRGVPGMIVTEKEEEWARNNLKNLTVDTMPGAHFLQEDDPERYGQMLSKWYAGIC